MLKANPLERRLQIAGVILILGLLVAGLCLLSHGAFGFLVFTGLAGPLILLGVVLYLLTLVRSDS
jgi:CHASE2 domain-containing sensor protein